MARYYVTGTTVPILVEDGQQICDGQSIQLVVEDPNNCPNGGATQFVTYTAEPSHPDPVLYRQRASLGNRIAGVPTDQRQNVYIINTTNDLPAQQEALKADVIHASLTEDSLVNLVDERGYQYVIAGSKLPANNTHEIQQESQQQQIQWINMPENNINYEAAIKPATPVTKMQPTVRTPQQKTAQSLTLQAQGQCSTPTVSQQYSGPGASDKKPIRLYKNKARGGAAGGGPSRQTLAGGGVGGVGGVGGGPGNGGGDVPPVKKSPQPRQKNAPKQQQQQQQSPHQQPQQTVPSNPSTPQQQAGVGNSTNNRTPNSNHSGAAYRSKTFGTPLQTVGGQNFNQRQTPGRPVARSPENSQVQARATSVAASPVMKSLPAVHYPAMDSLSERIKQAKLQKVTSGGSNQTVGNAVAGAPIGATPRPPLHVAQQRAQNTQQRVFPGSGQNQRSTTPTAASPLSVNQAAKQQQAVQQRQAAVQQQQMQNQAQQTVEFNKKHTSMSCQQKYQRETPGSTSDNDERMEVDSGTSECGVDGETNNVCQEGQNDERDGGSASVAYLQKVIENPSATVVQNQIDGNTVKMLVVLQNGEQRLVTFDIPNEPCTVQDLLEQVNVSFSGATSVSLVWDKLLGINYIVEDGTHMGGVNSHEESEPGEYQYHDNMNTPPDSSSPNFGASDENSNSSVTLNEEPKYIDGKVAVCPNCGIGSLDFNRCSRCKKRLPENVKSVSMIMDTQVKETMISIDSFYKKTHEQNALAKLDATMGKKRVGRGGRRVAAKTRPVKEPECLTISSDEEEDGSGKSRRSGSMLTNSLSSMGGQPNASSDEPDTIHEKEPVITNSSSSMSTECTDDTEGGIKGGGEEENIDDGLDQQPLTSLGCRTIRIGSYKFVPQEQIVISPSGVRIAVPLLEDDKLFVTLNVKFKDIVKVLIHFGRSMPVLFFYTTTATGAMIREVLGMQDPKGPYYDPAGKDHTHKRITLLPEILTDESKMILKTLFVPNNLLEELNAKEANDILVRASPRDNLQPHSLANTNRRQSQSASSLNTSANGGGIQIMTVYPPPPAKGGIAINTEDYNCLGEDQFLNDAIIDFYLRYLTLELLSDKDQNRTHVFSSYFYKRLTSPHAQVGESATTLTPAARRHARVQKWTKNVNIFEKDFIIIPINEHAHWFLAIICYPGLVGKVIPTPKTPRENSIQKSAQKSKKAKEIKMQAVTIGSTTITPLATTITIDQMDEGSERDEAEGDDEEMEIDSDDDEETESQEEPVSPPFSPMSTNSVEASMVKQPCILIFDSLAGASRSRVVATLRDYLSCEHLAKVGSDRTFSKDTIKGSSPKVPQQSNFTDCGLYLLQYVETFFKAPILNYTLPIKTLKSWFEEIVVTRKREELARLLVRLMKMTRGDKTILLPIVQFPTMDGKLKPKTDSPAEAKTPKVETDSKRKQLQQTPQATGNAEDKTRLVAVSTSSVTTTEHTNDTPERVTRTTTVYQIIGCTPTPSVSSAEGGGMSDTIFDAKPRIPGGTLSYLRNKRIPRLMTRESEGQENQSAAAKKHKGDNDLATKNASGGVGNGNNGSSPGSGIVPVVKTPSSTNYDSCK